jgi:hypothetical protein
MVYKYCNVDGFDILLKSEIKASLKKDFNDPFELVFGITDKQTIIKILQDRWNKNSNYKQVLIKALNIKIGIPSDDEIISWAADKIFEEAENSKKALDDYFNNLGIVCLSKKPDIIQMWAHYTNNHRGIVIGIDENNVSADKSICVNVEYAPEMVSLNLMQDVNDFNFHGFTDFLIRRKETNWGYEEEVRMYAKLDKMNSDGNYYLHISPTAIKEIYIGLNAHETTTMIANEIKQRPEYQHLKLYKMTKDNNAFKLNAVLL